MKPTETQLEKIIKPKFYGVSNVELVRRINEAPEIIWSHFRVESPDARQQRPEYLGGGTLNLNINPVTQTAPSVSGTTPQGNLAAFGTVSTQNSDIGFTYSSTEHQS